MGSKRRSNGFVVPGIDVEPVRTTSKWQQQRSRYSGDGWSVQGSHVNQIRLGRLHSATQRPALCRGGALCEAVPFRGVGTLVAAQDSSAYFCFRRPCGGRKLLEAK